MFLGLDSFHVLTPLCLKSPGREAEPGLTPIWLAAFVNFAWSNKTPQDHITFNAMPCPALMHSFIHAYVISPTWAALWLLFHIVFEPLLHLRIHAHTLASSRAAEAGDLFGSSCYCYGPEINHKVILCFKADSILRFSCVNTADIEIAGSEK